jgi:hypothetical protein
MNIKSFGIRIIIGLALMLSSRTSSAYSILAHEALIDSCWAKYIEPLLLSKFPGSTAAQLKLAHAYAYGGAITPDIGYFPFGRPLFTNLVHYVRSGDFVDALLDDSKDINEYAFSVGFLCHYIADKYGHSLATNKCVPLLYPKEREKYGNLVTYEEDHLSHKRTEFAFDVLQVVEGDYSKLAYRDFIGFQISSPVLERAFSEVYGLDIHKIFASFPLAVATLRWSFKRFFPTLTKAAWVIKTKQLKKDKYKQAVKGGHRPGLFSYAVAVFIEVIPKIGPLRVMKFKTPGPEVQKLYHESFDTALYNYAVVLRACRSGTDPLANVDFDTGNFTTPGEYGLADKNYDLLVVELEKDKFRLVSSDLRKNIVDYYSCRVPPVGSPKAERGWQKTEAALQEMRQAKVETVARARRMGDGVRMTMVKG